MRTMEKKLNAIMQFLVAYNSDNRTKARKEMLNLLQDDKRGFYCVEDLEYEVQKMLLELGVPDRLLGHRYLVTAIMMVIQNPTAVNGITTQLYPAVGEAHGCTAARAERAIRHAITVCVDRGDPDVHSRIFGNTVSPRTGAPVNSEFISRVANEIKMRLK